MSLLEVKNPNLSVEELMKKIKAELAASEDGRGTRRPRARSRSTLMAQQLRDGRLGLKRYDDPSIEFRDHYTLAELLDSHDELFVRNAYRAALQREPEPGGADNYLRQLREGELSKIELIGALRYSSEGNEQAVRIDGLRVRLAVKKLFHLPVIGYAVRWATAWARLPLLVHNFEQLHAAVQHGAAEHRQDIESLARRASALAEAKQAAENRAQAAEKRLDAIERMLVSVRAEMQSATAQLDKSKADRIDNSSLPEFWLLDGNSQFLKRAKPNVPEKETPDKEWFYSSFEDAFRDNSDVRSNQRQYLSLIQTGITDEHPFLDCGCGRGEFLEALGEAGIPAIGVDVNTHEIARLAKRGMNVKHADILDWLRQSDEMYSGISALQVIEHLDNSCLMEFLNLAVDRLVPGGIMILETVNPHCPSALGNFYQDPTHIKPIPPELLQFLAGWHGLSDCKLAYFSLTPSLLRSFAEPRMNYQDYAVIGYKR